MDTLAFGYILPTTGRIRDFNPLETCAARRTRQKIPSGNIALTVFLFNLIYFYSALILSSAFTVFS